MDRGRLRTLTKCSGGDESVLFDSGEHGSVGGEVLRADGLNMSSRIFLFSHQQSLGVTKGSEREMNIFITVTTSVFCVSGNIRSGRQKIRGSKSMQQNISVHAAAVSEWLFCIKKGTIMAFLCKIIFDPIKTGFGKSLVKRCSFVATRLYQCKNCIYSSSKPEETLKELHVIFTLLDFRKSKCSVQN